MRYAMALMNGARLAVGAQAVGIAEAAYREAYTYAMERHQCNQPICDLPPVSRMLASMRGEIEATARTPKQHRQADDAVHFVATAARNGRKNSADSSAERTPSPRSTASNAARMREASSGCGTQPTTFLAWRRLFARAVMVEAYIARAPWAKLVRSHADRASPVFYTLRFLPVYQTRFGRRDSAKAVKLTLCHHREVVQRPPGSRPPDPLLPGVGCRHPAPRIA